MPGKNNCYVSEAKEDENAERNACPYPPQWQESNHQTEVHLESAKDESWG